MALRIININVNGMRSAVSKGLLNWLSTQDATAICLQEVRAPQTLLEEPNYQLPGYESYYQLAQKPGYSGVGILTRQTPIRIVKEMGLAWADLEGRYLHLEFEQYHLVSVYFPAGVTSDARQTLKYEFLDYYYQLLQSQSNTKPWIIAGDINIAHKPIDLKNWRANQNHTGFLPQERAWLDKVVDELGLVDAFRVINQEAEQYTWWSNFAKSFEKNVGWRIDYQLVSATLKSCITQASIYKLQRFSDHAPLIIDYSI